MLARYRAHVLSLASFCLFSSAAFAQITAVEGDVKGPDGQPVKGASILIERQDMKGVYKGAKTDKRGHYIYNGLPIGTYKISVIIDGEVRDSLEKVRTTMGDPVPVNFDLKAKQADAAAVQKTLESGGELTKEQERGLTKEQIEALQKRAKENREAMAHNKALNDAFNGGNEAMLAKNYQAAADSFSKATELDAKQPSVWASLAEAEGQLAKTQTGADQQASLEKGIAAFQKAIELKPDEPGYHNNYALALANAKKFDEAQAELQKAAELDPKNAGRYYYNLGALLMNTGQNGPACQAFEKSIQADAAYADAEYQLGLCLVAKATTTPDGKVVPPPGTVEAFQKYLELAPTGPFAQPAKDMLATLGGTVQTQYQNPDAKKAPPKKK